MASPVPHVGGPILGPGLASLVIGGQLAARVTDLAVCVGAIDSIASGSATVLAGGLCIARLTDPMTHGGKIVAGLATVLVGGPASGSFVGILPNGLRIERNAAGDLVVGNHITIEGNSKFQAQVITDLMQIGATRTGAALLSSIDVGSYDVTITSTKGGNQITYDSSADRFYRSDGSAGAGSGSTITYNPNRNTINTHPWGTRPPAIGLAHELIHAEQASYGTTSSGRSQNDLLADPTDPSGYSQANLRELETVGVPPNDTRTLTENQIRSEWDPVQPNRDWY